MPDTTLPNEHPDDFPERYRQRKVLLRFIPEPDTPCGFNEAPDEIVVVEGGKGCPGGLLVFGRHDAWLQRRRWEPNSGERYVIRHLLAAGRSLKAAEPDPELVRLRRLEEVAKSFAAEMGYVLKQTNWWMMKNHVKKHVMRLEQSLDAME